MKEQLILGLCAGASAAATSITFAIKNASHDDAEPFDYAKIGVSVVLAFGVGFVSGFWAVPENVILASPVYAWASLGLENVGKFIYRKYLYRFFEKK